MNAVYSMPVSSVNRLHAPRLQVTGRLLVAALALALLSVLAEVAGAQEAQVASAGSVEMTTIDINQADAAQLAEGLVGIGLSKAEAIVRYREQFGPFESVDELSEVKGIGTSTIERNRARIRLQ